MGLASNSVTASHVPFGVMLVDDSAVARAYLTRILQDYSDFAIRASVANGELAVKALKNQNPVTPIDLIILDAEMPVMTGIEAIPHLLALDPNIQIIMASSLSERQAELSLSALAVGARDFIAKPGNGAGFANAPQFSSDLVQRLRALGQARRNKRDMPAARPRSTATAAKSPVQQPTVATPSRLSPTTPLSTAINPIKNKPAVLAIGCSTGGPQALLAFLQQLRVTPKIPVFVTQHMPPMFTKIFAEQISKQTAWECLEAQHGMLVEPGRIYLAPGDYHMTVGRADAGAKIVLNQDAQENFCRPAVDPMLRSLASFYGARNMAVVILTGMGSDGHKGAEPIAAQGGTIIAQDEKTAVVWGMPGAVAKAGICSAVLPMQEIAPYMNSQLARFGL